MDLKSTLPRLTDYLPNPMNYDVRSITLNIVTAVCCDDSRTFGREPGQIFLHIRPGRVHFPVEVRG